jgi:hypothetical protein
VQEAGEWPWDPTLSQPSPPGPRAPSPLPSV